MLALKSNTGFEVMDSDELYFINGGSGGFNVGTYDNGNGSWGAKIEATWTSKDGSQHGFEAHAGVDSGKIDVGFSWY